MMNEKTKEESKELIFTAKLVSSGQENKDREFVIRMSTTDD